jgi:hypothetical protein
VVVLLHIRQKLVERLGSDRIPEIVSFV